MENKKTHKWAFDPYSRTIACEGMDGIKIIVARTKVRDSGRENLLLTINKLNESGNKDVKLEISLVDIEKELFNLRNYGIILQRPDISLIRREIEAHYYDLPLEDENSSYDEKLDLLLEDIAEYILNNGIEKKTIPGIDGVKTTIYPIKTEEFEKIFKNGDFKEVNVVGLRNKLSSSYTKVNPGRSTYLIREKDRSTRRVVAVLAEKIDNVIDKLSRVEAIE